MEEFTRTFENRMNAFHEKYDGILFSATGPIPRPPNMFDVISTDIRINNDERVSIVYCCKDPEGAIKSFVDDFFPCDQYRRGHFVWWWKTFQHQDNVPVTMAEILERFDADLLARFVKSVYVNKHGHVINSATSMRDV